MNHVSTFIICATVAGHMGEETASKKRSNIWYRGNEPLSALNDYLTETTALDVDPVLNDKLVMSSSPGGYLKRKAGCPWQPRRFLSNAGIGPRPARDPVLAAKPVCWVPAGRSRL